MDSILDYDTVELNEEDRSLRIIDQTLLPGRIEIIDLTTPGEIWDAIYKLKVRGAPAIGVAAAIGMYVISVRIAQTCADNAASGATGFDFGRFCREFKKQKEYLNSSRPTAVNLSWALNCMVRVCREAVEKGSANGIPDPEPVLEALRSEALRIRDEDVATCRRIGENGLTLIGPGDGVLTHCNAGQLATVRYGTATAPMYLAHERNYGLRIYCDETRPLLQGARLTAYELSSAGMDVTLLCDNMAASLMKSGAINAVFVGADRIAANGDAANKIGTMGVATLAKAYGIPFYVCAPMSTVDPSTPDGDHIVIEQRPASEVTEMWYTERMAPEGVKVYNPAFDVTDHSLITAIITERGVHRAPYDFTKEQ